MRRFALSPEFWMAFHRERWERSATVLQRPFDEPITTPEACWPNLVTIADRYRRDDTSIELKFCIGETQQIADVGRYLPSPRDGSLAGYTARVTEMTGGRRFALVVEDYQAFDATLWLRLREFLGGIYEIAGFPRESAKATVFFGNYQRTPWGVHRGRSGNFQLVIAGPKRLRTWPDSYFREHAELTHRLDYAPHTAQSTLLEGDTGDILYWPSDAWHCGEAVGDTVSLAISVAMFIDQHTAPLVAGLAERMAQRRLGRDDRSQPLDIRPSTLADGPREIDALAARAVYTLNEVANDPDLTRRLRIAYLNHLSGFGFTNTPAPLARAALADDAVIQCDAAFPVLWIRDAGELICSASGHAFSVTATEQVISLLETLNAGRPHSVRALVAEYSGVSVEDGIATHSTPDGIRALLEKLVSLRAVVVRPSSASPVSTPQTLPVQQSALAAVSIP